MGNVFAVLLRFIAPERRINSQLQRVKWRTQIPSLIYEKMASSWNIAIALLRWPLSIRSRKHLLLKTFRASSSVKTKVTLATGGFPTACKSTTNPPGTVLKPLLARGLHKTLAELFASVAERIQRFKDLPELDVHLLVGGIGHVQVLDGNRLTARLHQNMMTYFILLLFLRDLHRPIATRIKIVGKIVEGKRKEDIPAVNGP